MESNVISFTPGGLAHIRNSIAAEKASAFRLAVKKTGCSGYAYRPEIIKEVNEDDLKFNIEDVTVCIDRNSAPYLQGTVIDFVDQGLGQTKMIFHNPNAANLCGCGESFNLPDE